MDSILLALFSPILPTKRNLKLSPVKASLRVLLQGFSGSAESCVWHDLDLTDFTEVWVLPPHGPYTLWGELPCLPVAQLPVWCLCKNQPNTLDPVKPAWFPSADGERARVMQTALCRCSQVDPRCPQHGRSSSVFPSAPFHIWGKHKIPRTLYLNLKKSLGS